MTSCLEARGVTEWRLGLLAAGVASCCLQLCGVRVAWSAVARNRLPAAQQHCHDDAVDLLAPCYMHRYMHRKGSLDGEPSRLLHHRQIRGAIQEEPRPVPQNKRTVAAAIAHHPPQDTRMDQVLNKHIRFMNPTEEEPEHRWHTSGAAPAPQRHLLCCNRPHAACFIDTGRYLCRH